MTTVPSKQPYNTVTEVTPELAAKWLEGNTRNRRLKDAAVGRLVRDMQAGRYAPDAPGNRVSTKTAF